MRKYLRIPNNETANHCLPTSALECLPRIALPGTLMRSLAIPDCHVELTREPHAHYCLLAATSTWTIRAIFQVNPGLVPGFTLGLTDGARQSCGLGAGTHTQLGQQVVHMILDSMNCDAQLVCDVAVR
jgi:hypothetical protein